MTKYLLSLLGIVCLFLVSGCGLYVREYASFEASQKPTWISSSKYVYCTITPKHSQKKVLLFYWSDVYSEPYRLDVVVESEKRDDSVVRIHEVFLHLNGKVCVLHPQESDPVEKNFSPKREYKAYETLFSFDLQDHVHFDEGAEFEAVVLWSVSEEEVRELKTKFKAVKSSDKSSIWSVMQGI